MRNPLEIKFYFAYTSPFSYLAYEPTYALERSYNVRVRPIPFGVNIRKVYGEDKFRFHEEHGIQVITADAPGASESVMSISAA